MRGEAFTVEATTEETAMLPKAWNWSPIYASLASAPIVALNGVFLVFWSTISQCLTETYPGRFLWGATVVFCPCYPVCERTQIPSRLSGHDGRQDL